MATAPTGPDQKLPPRVFIIQSPFQDGTGNNLVLGYDAVMNALTLQSQKDGLPQPIQLFKVYEKDGQIQNVGLGAGNGYLTRPTNGEGIVTLGTYKPGSKDQQWNFAAGPVPQVNPDPNLPPLVPGGGPHGNDKYTLVVDNIMKDSILTVALALTAQGLNNTVLVMAPNPQPIPDSRRLVDTQLWFFYWIPKLQFP